MVCSSARQRFFLISCTQDCSGESSQASPLLLLLLLVGKFVRAKKKKKSCGLKGFCLWMCACLPWKTLFLCCTLKRISELEIKKTTRAYLCAGIDQNTMPPIYPVKSVVFKYASAMCRQSHIPVICQVNLFVTCLMREWWLILRERGSGHCGQSHSARLSNKACRSHATKPQTTRTQ